MPSRVVWKALTDASERHKYLIVWVKQFSTLWKRLQEIRCYSIYEGWNFNSGNYLFTTDTK